RCAGRIGSTTNSPCHPRFKKTTPKKSQPVHLYLAGRLRINYKPRNSANRSPTIVAFSIAININRATTN
ncbi:MAG: hypothetical protein ACYCUV_03200, partial [Phycisphaerae bacterium]